MPRRGGGEEAAVSAAALALGVGGGIPWVRQRPGELGAEKRRYGGREADLNLRLVAMRNCSAGSSGVVPYAY